MMKKRPSLLLLAGLFSTLALTPACGSDSTGPSGSTLEWHDVPSPAGNVRVAVVPPADSTTGPHPVILALPWGLGSEDLVLSFISRYWSNLPRQRGYYLVSPAVRGTTLEDTAGDIIPAIFDWMNQELDYDPDKVALVGASNGGRGMFHAALAEPDRFATFLGMPGSYAGDPEALSVLVGKQVWLVVGEFDTNWIQLGEATIDALEGQGVRTRFDIAGNQGHVITINVNLLLDALDEEIGN